MDVLQFVLSTFWRFAGTVVLIAVTGQAVAAIIGAAWNRRTAPEGE